MMSFIRIYVIRIPQYDTIRNTAFFPFESLSLLLKSRAVTPQAKWKKKEEKEKTKQKKKNGSRGQGPQSIVYISILSFWSRNTRHNIQFE